MIRRPHPVPTSLNYLTSYVVNDENFVPNILFIILCLHIIEQSHLMLRLPLALATRFKIEVKCSTTEGKGYTTDKDKHKIK